MKFTYKKETLREHGYNIYFVKGEWSKALRFMNKIYGEDLGEFEGHLGFTAKKGTDCIIYVKDMSINTIIHEIVHCIDYIFTNNVYTKLGGDMEPLAYNIAYRSGEAIKFYRKDVKNIH